VKFCCTTLDRCYRQSSREKKIHAQNASPLKKHNSFIKKHHSFILKKHLFGLDFEKKKQINSNQLYLPTPMQKTSLRSFEMKQELLYSYFICELLLRKPRPLSSAEQQRKEAERN
jgi:hypothetical protein